MARTGAREKLTPEVQARIIEALKLGNYRTTAAKYAGISWRSFCLWMEKGRAARSGRYRTFCALVEDAEAQTEAIAVGKILTGDPKWWLSRKRRKNWGDRVQVDHAGVKDKPIETRTDLGKLSQKKLDEIERILAIEDDADPTNAG